VSGPGRPSVLVAVEQLRRRVPGGIGTYARGLLAGLAAHERSLGEPLAVTLYASAARPDPLAGTGRPVLTSRLPSRLLTRAWGLGLAAAPPGFDVVHSVSLAAPPVGRGGARLVVMVHDLAWRSHPEATTARGRRWHERALRRALRRADAFVVPSEAVAGELTAAGARPSSVVVIREGADHLLAPDHAGARDILLASGVDGPYLLAVSTLEPRKNLRRLVQAYELARAGGLGTLPLVVAGPLGWGDVGLAELDSDGVVAVGHVEDAALSALYAGAVAFVYVPVAEGYGLPPLEAMASGTPVVASTAVPSVTESDAEPPALLVDPADTDAIASALVSVVADAGLAASLRSRGASFAATRSWEAAAVAHLELWGRLV